MTQRVVRQLLDLLERYRFRALLALLVGAIVLRGMVPELEVVQAVLLALTGLIFIGTLRVTSGSAGLSLTGTLVTVVWICLTASRLAGMDALHGVGVIATLVVVALVAWATFAALFLEAKADADALAGAIFGYFLLALLWATLFDALEQWQPGSFALTGEQGPASELFYFSLVTITTLGYGDVLPLSGAARTLAGMEAAVGTLYLAILIGRIVGALKPRAVSTGVQDGTAPAGED